MVRKHKAENQRSVSDANKEESGASKRKRQLERDKNLDSCRNGLAKFLRQEQSSAPVQTNLIVI